MRDEQDETFVIHDYDTFFLETKTTLQVISCKETSNIGFLLRILRRTMTSFGNHTIKEPQLGFLRPMHYQYGNRLDPSYGYMGNVCLANHQRVVRIESFGIL